MSTVKSFEELIIWQEARKFTNNIYKVTKKFPKEELYGLTSQMRRAAVSVMSNLKSQTESYPKITKINEQIGQYL